MEYLRYIYVFRAIPRGRTIYFGGKVVLGDTTKVKGVFVKKKKGSSSPGDITTFLPLFRPFGGREGGDKTRTGALTEDIKVFAICQILLG